MPRNLAIILLLSSTIVCVTLALPLSNDEPESILDSTKPDSLNDDQPKFLDGFAKILENALFRKDDEPQPGTGLELPPPSIGRFPSFRRRFGCCGNRRALPAVVVVKPVPIPILLSLLIRKEGGEEVKLPAAPDAVSASFVPEEADAITKQDESVEESKEEGEQKIPDEVPVAVEKVPDEVPVAEEKVPDEAPVAEEKIAEEATVVEEKIPDEAPVAEEKPEFPESEVPKEEDDQPAEPVEESPIESTEIEQQKDQPIAQELQQSNDGAEKEESKVSEVIYSDNDAYDVAKQENEILEPKAEDASEEKKDETIEEKKDEETVIDDNNNEVENIDDKDAETEDKSEDDTANDETKSDDENGNEDEK